MKTKKLQAIAFDTEVTIEAASADESAAKSPRKFDVLAYTGGPINVRGYDLPVVVDLAGVTKARSLVANLDHDQSKRVGNVTAVANDGKELRLSGTASAATIHRDEVIQSAADGFVWQASIEASPTRITELSEGKKQTINGREITGPAYVVRAATLKGFAFVSHGADDETQVKIAASAAHSSEKKIMEPELKAFIEAIGLDPENIEADALAAIKANFAGKQSPPKAKGKLADITAAAKAENDRLERLAEIAAEFIALNPSQLDVIEAMGYNAERSKMTPEEFELQLSRATRPQSTTIMRGSGRNAKVTNKILEAAICQQGRLPDLEKKFDDQTLQAAHDQFGRDGISLRHLFILAARENGYRGEAYDVTLDVQRHAFGMVNHGRQIQASGFSTLNIAGILSNTANKFLQEGWMGQDMAWSQIAKRRSVRDFKTVTSYKLSGSFTYAKVGPGGELTHGTVSEDSYTNKADTYGRMFAISRTDIINDDLNAITQIPTELGMGANDAFNQIFWTEFLDNSAFFASGNSNVSTADGTLGITGLGQAEVIFMAQTKPNGTPLGLMPSTLLVPTSLRNTALTLMNSAQLIDGTATATQGSANIYQGRYNVVSSPYMENSAYTGYSAVAWYLLANPARLATIEAAFLNGRESPTVETAEADFNVLGVQMRAYHDFGVNLQEYRAGVRADGSGA